MMMNYPAPIHHLLEGTPTRFHAATAQAVFPALATYVPGDVVGKFPLNNETYRLNCGFFSLLCGDSASGKSLVDRVVNRIMAPIVKEDQLRRLKYNEYLEKLERATKHTKRLPKKPHVFYRSLSANITEAALLERLQWAEQNGMGCACHILMAELDQLITMCGSADLASAYIRLMFKGESTGKELKTSASHAGIPCALNLNVSCTPGVARTRLGGKAAYDGTTGRVNAILMPTIDGVESLLNFEAVMDFTKEFDNRLTATLNSLSSFHGLVDTPPELAEAVRETYERLTRYYYTTLDQKRLATWTLRSSIIAWKKGLLMMMMQGGGIYTRHCRLRGLQHGGRHGGQTSPVGRGTADGQAHRTAGEPLCRPAQPATGSSATGVYGRTGQRDTGEIRCQRQHGTHPKPARKMEIPGIHRGYGKGV